MKVSKSVKKMRYYESTLLSVYKVGTHSYDNSDRMGASVPNWVWKLVLDFFRSDFTTYFDAHHESHFSLHISFKIDSKTWFYDNFVWPIRL